VSLLRRFLAVLTLTAVCAAPAAVQAQEVTPPEGYPERVLGDPDAPITIYEYSSLTCPHCATFHEETLPKLQEAYIDTGKAKLVFRDFPLDPVAMAGALMARCAPEPMYFKLINVLFDTQKKWSRADQPLEALKQYGRLAGMDGATIDACFENEDLFKAIQAVQQQAQDVHKINSTPSFVIDGTVHPGAIGFDYVSRILDSMAAE